MTPQLTRADCLDGPGRRDRTINNLDYIVFDFETTGLDHGTPDSPGPAEAIQVGGKAYNARTLEPYPPEAGGEFCSLMRPLRPELLDSPSAKKALEVNKKTREEILAAPDQKVVWNQFVEWVKKFNRSKNTWGAPIACGKNIVNFDMKFVAVLNRLHSPKGDSTLLFSARTVIDLEMPLFLWFENEREPENMKMDTLREYFGMETEGAHDAIVDCRQTGELLFSFLKLHRDLQQRRAKDGTKLIKFQGSRRKAA